MVSREAGEWSREVAEWGGVVVEMWRRACGDVAEPCALTLTPIKAAGLADLLAVLAEERVVDLNCGGVSKGRVGGNGGVPEAVELGGVSGGSVWGGCEVVRAGCDATSGSAVHSQGEVGKWAYSLGGRGTEVHAGVLGGCTKGYGGVWSTEAVAGWMLGSLLGMRERVEERC